MKNFIRIFSCFLFVLLVVSGCSCKKDDEKVSLGIGDMNADTYKIVSLMEVDAMIENKDSFILYVYSETCEACKMFKPILENVIKEKHVIVYALTYNSITNGHDLAALKYTPSIVIYDEGEVLIKTDPNKNSEYFENNNSFISFLDKYTYMPTMYYISKTQLKEKINNNENFIIYYSRNDCGDCAYMYNNYLKQYLYNNPKTKRIYVIETNTEGIRLTDGVVNAAQWQAFKDEFGLSEANNSTFGYGVGYVPTIQYYNNGEIKDMLVYFNDDMSYVTNSDGSTTVTINGSYYSDNPYIGESMLYSDYKETLAPFYNEKLTKFLNNNLGLVD